MAQSLPPLHDLADRAWFAYHCLPRSAYGAPPPRFRLESDHGLPLGLLWKLFSGSREGVRKETLERLAVALAVPAAWLRDGDGDTPALTGAIPIVPYRRLQAAEAAR